MSNILSSWCLFPIVLQLLLVAKTVANGFLELEMVSYTNNKGKDWNGNNCDNIYWVKKCDTILTFCVDHTYGNNNAENCAIFKERTGEYKNINTIKFSSNMRGVTNPIRVDMVEWKGSIKFKVKVIDDDSSMNKIDKIDTFSKVMTFSPSRSEHLSEYEAVTLYGERNRFKTKLYFLRRFYCESKYFGSACSVYCEAKNGPTFFYTCNPKTGAKICRPGYEGSECNIQIDDCKRNKCKNGATCHDGHMDYNCECILGYSGKFCEIDNDDCLKNGCLNNATCVDEVNSYSCDCTHGYVGILCGDHICADISPCQNGGTCYLNETLSQPQCLCTPQYKGINCTINRCSDVKCRNNGTCYAGECQCAPGYLGPYCHQAYCDILPCHHGSTCQVDTCNCTQGYSGKFCEDEINYCLSQPCAHDGMCVHNIGGFTCKCLPDYEGLLCTHLVPEVSTVALPTIQPVVGVSSPVPRQPVIVKQCEKVPLWSIIIICIQFVIIIVLLLTFLFTMNKRRKYIVNQQRHDALCNRPVTFHRELSTQNSEGNAGISNPHYEETVQTPVPSIPTMDSTTMTVEDPTPPPYEEIGPALTSETPSEHPYEDCSLAASNPLYDVDITLEEKKDGGHENLTFYGDISETTQGETSGENSNQTKENIYQQI